MARQGVLSGGLAGHRVGLYVGERRLELRARARRANMLVRERETPARPAPVQEVRALGQSVAVSGLRSETRNAYVQGENVYPFVSWYDHLYIALIEDD